MITDFLIRIDNAEADGVELIADKYNVGYTLETLVRTYGEAIITITALGEGEEGEENGEPV